MTCDEARALLDADQDRELDPLRSAELGRHLAGCDPCRARAAARLALRDALREKAESLPRRRWASAAYLAAVGADCDRRGVAAAATRP